MPILAAIVAACLTYIFTKWREREAEWRKEKLYYYKAYVESFVLIRDEGDEEGQRVHKNACNTIMLFAPQAVIDIIHEYEDELRADNQNRSKKRNDELLTKLFLEMRKDLKITPKDRPETFAISLWAQRHRD